MIKNILYIIRSTKYRIISRIAKDQIEDARIDAYEDGFNKGLEEGLKAKKQ